MDKFSALSRGTQILAASAILLLIDTFFAWQKVCANPLGTGEVCGPGINAWHGFWGVVLGLLTLAAIAWIVVRLAQPELLKSIPIPEGTLALALGALILLFAVLKNLIDDFSRWPAYVGVVLAAGVAFGGWLVAQEQGGTEKAMAWRPSSGSSSAAPPPAAEPSAPPAAAPPAPPAAAPPTPPAAAPPAPPETTTEAAPEEPSTAAPQPWSPPGTTEEPPREER